MAGKENSPLGKLNERILVLEQTIGELKKKENDFAKAGVKAGIVAGMLVGLGLLFVEKQGWIEKSTWF